jgi:hypothetical protein
VKRVAPKRSGYKRDLYADPRENAEDWAAHRLETELFAEIDCAAAKALEVIAGSQIPTRDDSVRTSWTRFLRSMLHRTPQHMAATLSMYEQIWRTPSPAIQAKYEKMRKPGYPPTAEQFLEALNPNEARDTSYRLYFDALTSNRLTDYINRLEWRILDCSTANFKFLLSDNPVILVPLERQDGHLAMPLSPTKLLMASAHKEVIDRAARLSRQALVRITNTLSVERAYHCVISADRRQEAFVRRHFGKRRIGSLATGFRQT